MTARKKAGKRRKVATINRNAQKQLDALEPKKPKKKKKKSGVYVWPK